jgi:hypothetical protein
MLILHAASTKAFGGAVFVWAEADGKDRPQRKGKSRWKWLAGAREHPYHGDRDRLRAVDDSVVAERCGGPDPFRGTDRPAVRTPC